MQHFNIKEHVVPACHIREYAGSTSHSQEDLLQLHVKQYTPKSPSNDPHAITLIATHGVGLPKVCHLLVLVLLTVVLGTL